MNHSPFNEREFIKFAVIYQHVMRKSVAALPMAGVTALLLVGLIVSGSVEYAINYEIFYYLKAPLPGESASWSVALFAMTGVLMALALHLHASEFPNSPVVRWLQRCVVVLVPLYAIGAGLALAAILYFDGADALFTAPAAATMQLFSDAAKAANSPLLDKLIANFALIFVLGCGGLALIIIYIFHKLASLIRENVQELTQQAFTFKTAREAMTTIRVCDKEYVGLSRQREALGQQTRGSEADFANHIAALIHRELVPAEKWLLSQQIHIKAPEPRFVIHEESGLDYKAVEKRVAMLRAIDATAILRAFHPENNRSKS